MRVELAPLDLSSDFLGFAGAVLLAVPLFRDFAAREVLHFVKAARLARGERGRKLQEHLAKVADDAVSTWRPRDKLLARWGIVCIALAFVLKPAVALSLLIFGAG